MAKTTKTEKIETVDTIKVADDTEVLKAKIDEMQKKMEAMMLLFGTSGLGQVNQTATDLEEEVVSLTHCMLNLSTEGNGKGNVYTFLEFGERQLIPTSDLKMILKNNKEFALDGRFYISNTNLIKANNLTGAYKNIIKEDVFRELFSAPKGVFEKTFTSIPETQQRVFADLLMAKAYNNEDVDLNIVGIVGKILKRDLMQEIQSTRVVYTKTE